ncbi:MAG: [FeFe] hydrogenase H-cluster radical SAM maturase HydE [Ignavibacteriae bacterium]|nr:[FeFe] hydrogenase H-cluster radical SAM maturase HydE [Ignavibacteriota bacterium]NOG99336.1 [FeFe] hydrogenase H-cluster radical SAM maturase HydE [Ignavibacteriota bacterium]
MNLTDLLNKKIFTKNDLITLLSLEKESDMNLLFQKADEVKNKYCGSLIHLRGIIEFSNYCRQDCHYCGIRNENDDVNRYRMSIDEILASAEMIFNAGIKTIVLQSGEDTFYKGTDIANIIRTIKEKFDVAITLSLGERTFEEYDEFKKAGADRYLLKHETANEKLYSEIHPHQKLAERISHLKYLKSIGFQVGSGNIIGLPNQTLSDIADDILLCGELNVDMASFSPFICAENTPLSYVENCKLDLALKTSAVARIYLKNVHIPATTALSTLSPDGRKRGLRAGANVIMPTYTPNEYRFNYLIYNNKPGGSEAPQIKLDSLYQLFDELDLAPSGSKGHSMKEAEV